jgi:hypothetical protein
MAEVIDLREFSDDRFVIHFGGERGGMDATTFAQALTGFTEALRSINRALEPGYDLDVIIEAVGPGSFRAQLRAVRRSAENLFSAKTTGFVAGNIALGVFTNLVYDKMFPDDPPAIHVTVDGVKVEHKGTTIIVSKDVFEAKKKVENNPTVKRHIAETLEAVDRDPLVTSLGITKSLDDPEPAFEIPRALFPNIVRATRPPEGVKDRTTEVEAQLTVKTAILERSKRKWEFYWNGHVIWAPIDDRTFFDRLLALQISLQHGDTFNSILRIRQVRDEMTGAWKNKSYEVLKVFDVVHRRGQQPGMFGRD